VTEVVERALAVLRTAAPDGLLVGGCVRDWLLSRAIKDLDVAIPIPAAELAPPHDDPGAESRVVTDRIQAVGRQVAASLGGAFFWLKQGMGVARVVLAGSSPLQIDVVPLEGSVEADLRRRDFTINAMAVPVADGFRSRSAVIDPTGGMADLAERRLRLAAPDALERDPLRCLRAFRFRATLGFEFDAATQSALRSAAPGLARISGERIRDELFAVLESAASTEVVGELLAHDLISPWSQTLDASVRGPGTTPPDRSRGLPGLRVAEELEWWLRERAPELGCYEDVEATLSSRITPPRSRRALLRLAALASGSGTRAPEIARTLALSSDESRVLARAVAGADALAVACPLPGRGRLRFWQRWEPGAVEAALLSLDRDEPVAAVDPGSATGTKLEAARGKGQPTSVGEALLADLLERRLRPRAPLLTGVEVMAILDLPPGPEVGRVMQQLEEHRADGQLSTAEGARSWLQQQRSDGEKHQTD
jgi:poly(A) polymerase